MKVLVCGSRDWWRDDIMRERLKQLPRGTEIIHGGARGADRMAGVIANGLGFKVTEFPARWRKRGRVDRSAGLERNLLMLDQEPDLVLAFHLYNSTGTAHTVAQARKRGIPVEVFGV
jgi:SLOG family YspA-like protein